jgi:hypothetical protein
LDLDLKTNSTITNFKLEEESKKLSFTVEGQSGTHRTTEIPIGQVLDGPYTVTIDAQSTTNFQVSNEGTTDATIKISYTHSTHDITASDTNVVPEFPAMAIGLIMAIIVGMVAVMVRFKPLNRGF